MSSRSISSDELSDYDSDYNYYGEVLNDRYLILKKIGSGSFASVWLSYDIKSDTKSNGYNAIKIQNANDYDEGLDEIKFLSQIEKVNCPHLNSLQNNFIFKNDDGEHICMVSELMFGSVYEICKTGKYSDGLPLNIAVKILYQTCIALDVLHNKLHVVHTDIKPENILLHGISKKLNNIITSVEKYNLKSKLKGKKEKKLDAVIKEFIKYLDSTFDNSDSSSENDEDDDELIQLSDSDSDISDSSDSSQSITDIPLDEKYILNPKIKLSDFGNSIYKKDLTTTEIQTRYYRAPEVILGLPYNEKVDIWSLACTFYELLTGEILFNPTKTKQFSRDRQHLYDIQKLLGIIPKDIINKSPRQYVFFKHNGLLKGVNEINYVSLRELLESKLNSKMNTNSEEFNDIVNFFESTLEYNINKRMSITDCLNHKIFHKSN